MSTVDRYIQRLFLKNLAVILTALVSLYAIIDFIEKVDDFIEHQAALANYLLFPLYNLPLMVANTLPMAVLLSSFATIGGLSRSSQLTALLGGGLSFTRIGRPLFIIGLVLSALLLLGNLWLVPRGTQEAEYILETQVKGKQKVGAAESQDLYFRNDDRIVHVSRSFPQRGEIHGVTMVTFDERFKPLERLQAKSASYLKDGVWQFNEVKIWSFSPEDKSLEDYETHPELQMDMKKAPDEVASLWNVPEEMTQGELSRIIARLKSEGHDPRQYQVEAQLRFSRSCIPLVMILLGMPFALQRGRNASFALGVVVSLAIFIAYFLFYAIFAALGSNGILPPVVAAWSAHLLMGSTGIWMFLKAQD